MDAVKFLKEKAKMCSKYSSCSKCRFYENEVEPAGMDCKKFVDTYPERAAEFFEDWSKENPSKTRQDVFMEQWPNAQVDRQGILFMYPCEVDKTMRKKDVPCYIGCQECRAEFWAQEVE